MSTTRIFLVRHAESAGNALGIVQGTIDYDLSPVGELQAAATADFFARQEIHAVFTSPLLRAVRTAEVIAAPLELKTVPLDGLREYGMGEASGLTWAELEARYPEIMAAARRGERLEYPGEEGRELFLERLDAALATLCEVGGNVVAVVHGGVVNAICRSIMGIERSRRGMFHVYNCSITEVVPDRQGRLVIHRQNDVCHLLGLPSLGDNG